MENNTITMIELENHINKWFGSNWENQSSAQIYAMVIDLLAKVGTEIISEEIAEDIYIQDIYEDLATIADQEEEMKYQQ